MDPQIINIADIRERLSAYFDEENNLNLTQLLGDAVFVAKQVASLDQFLMVTLQIWSTMQLLGAKQ